METPTNILEDYLDRDQTAAALKVCSKTIIKYDLAGELKSVLIGRRKYYHRDWLRDFIERRASKGNKRNAGKGRA